MMKKTILLFSLIAAFNFAISTDVKAQTTVLKEYEITATDSKVFTLFVYLTADQGIQVIDVTDPGYTFATQINTFSGTHGGYEMSAYEGYCYFSDGIQIYTMALTLPVDGDGSGGPDEGLISITPWPYPYPPF
ncbi:hypothetical protein [Pedobacter frigoris]|uniref:Uncharacterized protein n=1 Tax=Pedobacter frigoris TaxID=2571272 RepID=A0A4U1CR52_9SPHI|nr:hypothetical protein [Pedobacter frigoris]TKC09390.1 hypothetical protein FA047_04655 [Pedobacter frigoris]